MRQRIQQSRVSGANTRTTWTLHPDLVGGLGFESESNTSPASVAQRHFISAMGQAIGVLTSTGALPTLTATQTSPPSVGSVALGKAEYWHKDHLGSIAASSDQTGALQQRYAYDPFGKRRYTSGAYDASGAVQADWSLAAANGTGRGFTGHEELDDVGLVHMNGRVYEDGLGVFLQADPRITEPGDLQNYNRYGYVLNNPLNATDPSGFDPAPADGQMATPECSCNYGPPSAPPSAAPGSSVAATPPSPNPGKAVTTTGASGSGGESTLGSVISDAANAFFSTIRKSFADAYAAGANETAGDIANKLLGGLSPLAGGVFGAVGKTKSAVQATTTTVALAKAVTKPSSVALARALELAGKVRAPGEAAHHIVAGEAAAAQPARDVLSRFSIGINAAENGVFLPANRAAPNAARAAVHSALHPPPTVPNMYYDRVNEMLNAATTRAEAIAVLNAIEKALLSGGLK